MNSPQQSAQLPIALSIAGSDSGGGAGIQADLRVFSRLGVFGTTVITAITAQNLDGVTDVAGLEADMVMHQIDAVVDGFSVAAVKTGMLWSSEIVERVAAAAHAGLLPRLVVDPVMVATSGARLLDDAAVSAYQSELLPAAELITPNLDEAAVLLGHAVERDQMYACAERLATRLGCSVLLKGGHLQGDPIDVLYHEGQLREWRHARIDGVNTHGSGCTLSAAIAGYRAMGVELVEACDRGLAFLQSAFAAARPVASRPSPVCLSRIELAQA
ncbi:MAG: bifunctional hydroxymethylpyrimidine kinase/phosphomethylpyrimidine kinase [Gammaproteobacteria bacterium]|nr:bifunctional hydroxymethylpyrimidine kinase/phosphomethylpyrimidine kinase [Gammaproteobacteria bacterium]